RIATIGVSCLLLAGLLLFAAADVFAQGVTSAAINGRVTGKGGEPLPGVNVIATHTPSGTIAGTITREDGRFNLPGLRVGGPYVVTASLVGYQKQSHGEIFLRLSENLDLNFTMSEEAVQAGEIVVTGERASVFNASRSGAATNVTRDVIDKLPTLTRNWKDYYKVSPYVTGDNGGALGRNSKYNNVQIDGTNFNDLFGLGSTGAPAGQSNVTPISLDAIEEFQIVVSPYDVRQAGFTGAGINAITRSGTNDYKGSAFYFGRNENFVGKSPDAFQTKLPGFSDYSLGGRLGGPIIENKLFFFVNAEITRFKQPFVRTFGNQQLGTNAFTVNADSLTQLTNYLKNKYGYDPGSFTNIGYIRESDKAFARLDYNISDVHKLTARWSYLSSTEDNSPSRGRNLTDIYADNGKYKLENTTNSLGLQLTSLFSNTMSNELILGYVPQKDLPIYYGQPFPSLYIATRGTGTAYTGLQDLVLGSEEFRHYNLLFQKTFEITDNFTVYMQDHTLTFGGRVDLLSFENLFIPEGFGDYAYSSIARFLQDLPPDGNTLYGGAYTYKYSATANPQQEANWHARQYGLYAQDEWTVTPTFKLTAGLRVDIPTYPDHPNYNFKADSTYGYRTDTPPKTALTFSPRVGFNWSIDEERTSQLRGGIGVFYGRFPFVWVSNQYSNTGVDFYTVTTAPTHFIADPYGQPKTATTLPTAEVDLSDPNFKAPSVVRWNIGFDKKLPYDITATIEGVFSLTINDVYYKNLNLYATQTNPLVGRPDMTPGGVIPGEGRPVWGKISDTNATKFNTVWRNNLFSPGVFLVTNTTQGSNSNVTFQVQRNAPSGLNGNLSYTWGMAKDINSGNSTTASSGWRFNPTQGDPNNPQLTYSQWDRRHLIVAALSYRQDWGDGFVTDLGVFYSGRSGRPFSYLVSGDVNGDGRTDNDLFYIPRDASDIILTNTAGTADLPKTDAAYAQLMAFINADPYLSANKGKISDRMGGREPWNDEIDMRLTQDIPVIAGHNIQITLDILNVLNLLNSAKGWFMSTGTNQNINVVTFKGLEKTLGADYGKPRYALTLPGSNSAP
ncbi:MAG TPA: carboxypeptidase regulatory-like domain-containing protein, partial [Bacteroidota bacterium]|nr:carboxypeptidase regulatory-like domain-containing protein [Bacteroidota bacterium]